MGMPVTVDNFDQQANLLGAEMRKQVDHEFDKYTANHQAWSKTFLEAEQKRREAEYQWREFYWEVYSTENAWWKTMTMFVLNGIQLWALYTQYKQQKEREEDEKLNAILKYTRDTFKRFDLDETEIFQICESVRYFVTNRQVLSMTEIHIKKHSSLTQISLKNFAWNIAFQYNIGGDVTTSFVIATFAEWFTNSTFDTVRKNLRTTTGRHKIEIDENILSKYGI